ncbi:MAG: response regulator [Terrimicrobiaceae bacterium]|nr:response regulator [Terrimicrobiaceae bacterium]
MKPKRILIVDDESAFTRLLRLTLEGTGKFLVEEVNDGRRTIEVARYFKPDIIFLDVVMPEIDGGDVATQIKADPELAAVPIVFLTAIVSPKEARHQSDIGGFPFLAKPVSVESIVQTVAAHCPS